MFNTQGTDTTERSGISKFIAPGVHVCLIKNVEFFNSGSGTPGMKLHLTTAPVPGLTDDAGNNIGQTCEHTYWLSPKAWSYTNAKGAEGGTKVQLARIADKLAVREQLDAISAETPEEYTKAVNALFKGKKARFAFGGQEIIPQDSSKSVWVKAELLSFKFVESLTDVPNDEDTKLVYDKTNAYHFKKAEVTGQDVLDAPSVPGTLDEAPW